MNKQMTVLIAEDDLQLGFLIKENLEEEGYEVINCPDGEIAWEYFQKKQPDICLLDINMPVRDGYSLAKKIRQKNDVIPIIFLTAKSMEEDKLKGFETGADDYITKPFSMKELLLRMNVFLRRNKMLLSDESREIKIGSLTFLPDEMKLVSENEVVTLTQRESELLEFFCTHPNKALKREDILTHVWGKNDYFLGRSMDVFVTKLRKHLKNEGLANIETVHNVGFRFNLPE
ncbi:MAG: response regulator transcription factor [Chitinophagaceae bacterium]|jgi:DNA-binding response OmpR family regulator|nr:response regulator transcription factor [Chitinophagaceae bacterium]OQY97023.1 MAG: DNA-binding response regulator [Sphingobacteriales bacterium UTBCD1]